MADDGARLLGALMLSDIHDAPSSPTVAVSRVSPLLMTVIWHMTAASGKCTMCIGWLAASLITSPRGSGLRLPIQDDRDGRAGVVGDGIHQEALAVGRDVVLLSEGDGQGAAQGSFRRIRCLTFGKEER